MSYFVFIFFLQKLTINVSKLLGTQGQLAVAEYMCVMCLHCLGWERRGWRVGQGKGLSV